MPFLSWNNYGYLEKYHYDYNNEAKRRRLEKLLIIEIKDKISLAGNQFYEGCKMLFK